MANEGATVGSVKKRNKMKKQRDSRLATQLGQTLIKKVNEGATVGSVMKRKKINEKTKRFKACYRAWANFNKKGE